VYLGKATIFDVHYKLKIMVMTETEVRAKIDELKAKLTGDLFADMEYQQEIYELKKILNPRIEEHPEEDDDECLSCGS
jgi:lactam utilization protein B